MKKLFLLVLSLSFCLTLTAQIPRLISYQGLLTDNSGQALADGTYSIEVKFFDALTGGTELWSENHSVNTTNGIFGVALGSNTALDLDFDQPYFVSTTVDGQELLPRTALTSAPYALNTAPKTRSVSITPGMIDDDNLYSNVARGKIGLFRFPSIDIPDGDFEEFTFQFPVPADYNGQGFKMRLLYTSDGTSGDFSLAIGSRGHAIGGDLTRAPGGELIVPSPTTAGTLAEASLSTGIFDPNSQMISFIIRRSGTNAADTSTDVLRFVGLIIEYTER